MRFVNNHYKTKTNKILSLSRNIKEFIFGCHQFDLINETVIKQARNCLV